MILFELNLETLYEHPVDPRMFAPLPRFPVCKRDLCLVVPIDLAEELVRETIRSEKTVERLFLYDLYQGEKVGPGSKSLTYELFLRAADRTLTDEDTNAIISRIAERLADLGVRLRS